MTFIQRLSLPLTLGVLAATGCLGLGLSVGFTLRAGTFAWQPLLPFVLVSLLIKLLYVRIDIGPAGLVIYLSPFYQKRLAWAEVERLAWMGIDPLDDFGGWGIKYSQKYGAWGFIFQGTEALLITPTRGKPLVVTAPQAEAMQAALQQYGPPGLFSA